MRPPTLIFALSTLASLSQLALSMPTVIQDVSKRGGGNSDKKEKALSEPSSSSSSSKNPVLIYNDKTDSDNQPSYVMLVRDAINRGVKEPTDILLCGRPVSYDYERTPGPVAGIIINHSEPKKPDEDKEPKRFAAWKKLSVDHLVAGRGNHPVPADLSWTKGLLEWYSKQGTQTNGGEKSTPAQGNEKGKEKRVEKESKDSKDSKPLDLKSWLAPEDDWESPRVKQHSEIEMKVFVANIELTMKNAGIDSKYYNIYTDVKGTESIMAGLSHQAHKVGGTFDFTESEMEEFNKILDEYRGQAKSTARGDKITALIESSLKAMEQKNGLKKSAAGTYEDLLKKHESDKHVRNFYIGGPPARAAQYLKAIFGKGKKMGKVTYMGGQTLGQLNIFPNNFNNHVAMDKAEELFKMVDMKEYKNKLDLVLLPTEVAKASALSFTFEELEEVFGSQPRMVSYAWKYYKSDFKYWDHANTQAYLADLKKKTSSSDTTVAKKAKTELETAIPMFDVLAALLAIEPEIFGFKAVPVESKIGGVKNDFSGKSIKVINFKKISKSPMTMLWVDDGKKDERLQECKTKVFAAIKKLIEGSGKGSSASGSSKNSASGKEN